MKDYKVIITRVRKNKDNTKTGIDFIFNRNDRQLPDYLKIDSDSSFVWIEGIDSFNKDYNFGEILKGSFEPIPGTYYYKLCKLEDKSGNVIYSNK